MSRRIDSRYRARLLVGWGMFAVSLLILRSCYEGANRPRPPGAGTVLPW